MAIFYCEAKIISRGKGQSVVAHSAYISREKLKDRIENKTKDYKRKSGLIARGISAPEGSPEWARRREELWNKVEEKESESKRWKTAQLARSFIVALPHELSAAENTALVREIAADLSGRGMVTDWAVHKADRGGDQRNVHAHLLTTMREISREGFGKKKREWDDKKYLEGLKERIAEIMNERLCGLGLEVDGRSYEKQNEGKAEGERKAGQEHRGVARTAVDRKLARIERELERTETALKRYADKEAGAPEDDKRSGTPERSEGFVEKPGKAGNDERKPPAPSETAVKTAGILEPVRPKQRTLKDKLKAKLGGLKEWLEEPILTKQVDYVRDKLGDLKEWFEKPLIPPKARQSERESPPAPATPVVELEKPETTAAPEQPAPITAPETEPQTANEQFKALIEKAGKENKLPWRKYHQAGTIPRLYDPISRTEFAGRNFIAALLHKELSGSQDPRFFSKEALKEFGLSVKPEAKPVLLMFKREENGAEVAVTKAYYNAEDIRERDELPPAQKLARIQAGTIQAERGKTAVEQFGKDLTAFLRAAGTGKGFAPSNRSFPFEAMKDVDADRIAMAAHNADMNQRILEKTEKERQNAQSRNRTRGDDGFEW